MAFRVKRNELSKKYITNGNAIEIGGLNAPLLVSNTTSVTYVDRMSMEELQRTNHTVVPVDLEIVVDSAETLSQFDDRTMDYVIANHVLEHCENPVLAIENWMRVLKSGGIVFCALPEKDYTFDKYRDITPWQHILRDYKEGPNWSLKEHYIDWYDNSELEGKKPGNMTYSLEYRNVMVERSIATKNNIHFHVWDFEAMKEMFERSSEVVTIGEFIIKEGVRNHTETIWILQKN